MADHCALINLALPINPTWTRHALLLDVEAGTPVALTGDDPLELAECLADERTAFTDLVTRLEAELTRLTKRPATPLVESLLSGARADLERRLHHATAQRDFRTRR